jgi:trk system potassium uptake protein TrkH
MVGSVVLVAQVLRSQARPLPGDRAPNPTTAAGKAGLFALIGLGVADPPWVGAWSGTVFVLALVSLAVYAGWRRGEVGRRVAAGVAASWAALPLSWAIGAGDALPELSILTPALAAMSTSSALQDESGPLDVLLLSPARFLVASFAILCAAGGLALSLPIMSTAAPLRGIDALFTATSAACVTGLGVVDTGTAFSGLGQGVILVLIQVGGLGIMTFASAAAVFAGRRLSLRQESVTADLLGADARQDLRGALRNVLVVTFVSEFVGAVLLTVSFMARGDTFFRAAWRGVFTSISAFCNAGFALQADSLVGYSTAPDVLAVVAALIVVGGLGPAVVVLGPGWWAGRVRSVHVGLVLASTALLLVVPGVLFLAWEWNASLASYGVFHKVTNAAFQSVTLRTAGFNSVDLTATTAPTWTLMLFCMFVGGSPGSTAGGIKTTTLAVLALAAGAAIRGRESAIAFGRRIAHRTVYEAMAITGAGFGSALLAVFALQMTQDIPYRELLFEVVSALGTVGLTLGGTAALDDVGKVVIMACMFAGRVGPVTLFALLATRESSGVGHHPVAPVPVG